MRRRKSKAKASTSNHGDNLPLGTTGAETVVSNSVMVDGADNYILCQSEYEVQTVEEAGKEASPTFVDCNNMGENKIVAAEEEHMYAVHTEEVEMGLQEAKEGDGEEGREEEPDDDDDNQYNGGGGGQEEPDQYYDINGHDDDADDDEDLVEYEDNSVDGEEDLDENEDTIDDDEDPDEYDDDTVDDEEDCDNEDFDEDDDFSDHDDERAEIMEEDGIDENAELQNNDNNVEEGVDIQRNTVEEGTKPETAREENQKGEGGSLKKKVLRKGSQRKNQRNTVEGGRKQECVKEGNEEIEGGSSQKMSREGSEWKKVTTEASDKVASESKYRQGDAMEGADQERGKEVMHDKEGSHKQEVKKLNKKSRRKVATEGFKELGSKRDEKVESPGKKKSSKKVESMGMIFMCSSKTKRDCYQYKVLGLPANKRDEVSKIYKGMRLFLYDFDLKLMYGIYKAAGAGGYNIQPRAFNSQFPSQVRFTVLEDCLPVAEEKFREVIKDNYYTKTKFNCRLTSQQVKNLCKLFVSSSKGAKTEVLARRPKARAAADQVRSRAPERQSAMDEECVHRKYPAKRKRGMGEYPSRRKREMREYPSRRKREVVEHSSKRKRKVVAPQVVAVPRVLSPPAVAAPLYAYDRAMEMDAYRRDLSVKHLDSHRHLYPEPRDAYRAAPLVEYRDVYRRDPLLDRLDPYRRDVAAVENLELRALPEHHDLRYQDEIGRHDRYISYRERPEHRDLRYQDDLGRRDLHLTYRRSPENLNLPNLDDIGRRDPYISYRERLAYRDRVYGSGSLPEHDHYRPISRSTEYRPSVAALPEYRSAVAAHPEYRPARPLHRY